MELRYRIDNAAVKAALERVADALPKGGDFSPVTSQWARQLKTGAQLRFRTQRGVDGNPWPKSYRAKTEGGQTLSLTRRLRNSITSAHSATQAVVGTNVIYAAIHQFGGTIRAKKGPFLSIPLTDAARQAGSPRNMPGLAVWQTVKGQFVMGTDDGTVHFLLRAAVTMPSRPYLGVGDADEGELKRVLQDHLTKRWGG